MNHIPIRMRMELLVGTLLGLLLRMELLRRYKRHLRDLIAGTKVNPNSVS